MARTKLDIAMLTTASIVAASIGFAMQRTNAAEHTLMPSPQTVHIGHFSAALKPILTIESGDIVTIETSTQIDPAEVDQSGVVSPNVVPDYVRNIYREVKDRGPGVSSGRMAVFLGSESGFDHEGDPDVLAAFYRLGLRTVQFATHSGFNAFSDSELAPVQGGQPRDHFHGINERGRELVAIMNRLGILIDITHGTEAVHLQLIAASRAPVVASHETLRAVSGVGISDEVLKALAAKGGLIGIGGAAAIVGKRYRKWMAENPEKAANGAKAAAGMVGYQPSFARAPGDRGEFIARMDQESRERWRVKTEWREDPQAASAVPTADEWAEHVDYVIKTVGADHVAIGLDMVSGRSAVPGNASGYPDLVAALKRITSPENVRKITGENWFRVLDQAKSG